MPEWTTVPAGYDMKVGDTLRLTLWLRLPDTVELRNKVRNGILAADRLYDRLPAAAKGILGGMDIQKVETGAAATNHASGRLSPWPLRITFKKIGGGTPFLVVAGAIAALLIISVGAVVIVSRTFERVSGNINDLADRTINNPGLILAGLVGIALITARRR